VGLFPFFPKNHAPTYHIYVNSRGEGSIRE